MELGDLDLIKNNFIVYREKLDRRLRLRSFYLHIMRINLFRHLK